ncbi:helix-turn-helix transcriptional regulator [Roseivivax isoporae]|uniref:HTH araC/xylS-type domain-containing protein n=1 Tax=Roseivivax isoporae LMG 25204 TaxID=1449351 RepID=X7F7S1_9RHOB|nr:AraC family transcriptional regulator [Roseivivax isoporae]ETX28962.1 hypothetical protein RISW2_03210 [Roseivivax isoporae LMG 25204]
MRYRHDFEGVTEKIRSIGPVRWHQFDTVLPAYWEAAGATGGRGSYVSANPRISVFFDDVSSIRVLEGTASRPLPRAIFVPAGMALQTMFTRPLVFSHLDVHMDAGWAVDVLSGAMSRAAALRLLAQPAERHDTGPLEVIARLLVDELDAASCPDLYAQSLAGSLVAAILDIGAEGQEARRARLTAAQMRKVCQRFDAGGGRGLPVAHLAAAVNLSESWFSQVFKNTTGMTPHQWQRARRIEHARALLSDTSLGVADVADRLGFSDQAHLTRTFRQVVGETPAAWRRRRG